MSQRNVLAAIPTLKLRLSAIIVAAVAVTVGTFYLTLKELRWWPGACGLLAAGTALIVVWLMSRGTLEPLRDITAASEAIARGEFETRVVATSRDEIGRLASSFNSMAQELAKTDRVRRDLVANVSHELRTPLTSLQAKLENIADGIEQADSETVAVMLSQTERLGRLVKQLLDLSRLEAGTVPLDRRPFELRPMLELAARESQLGLAAATIEVAVEPRDLTIDGDAERLHQVVANLVENAQRYSPAGGTIALAARRVGAGVCIEVADDGPGIAAGETDLVFERFYRSDSARSSRDGGAGLGLSIARWIVDLHGGSIRPEARTPHGCRMVVTLPGLTA